MVLFNGLCVGGPFDGQPGQSRYPYGFLLVDRPHRKVWHYNYHPAGHNFVVQNPDGDPEDVEYRHRILTEFRFDVRAMP